MCAVIHKNFLISYRTERSGGYDVGKGLIKSVKRFSSRKEKVNVANIYFRGKRCGINVVLKVSFPGVKGQVQKRKE